MVSETADPRPLAAEPNAGSSALPRLVRQLLGRLGGIAVAGIFYLLVVLFPVEQVQRYFLGHPVAVAATVLFCIASVSLARKWLGVRRQSLLCDQIRNEDLAPAAASLDGHSGGAGDVRLLAGSWLRELAGLPQGLRESQLVVRLRELLERQVRRGNARQLADDLREVSARDADAAHDSLQLVRIIVWAIPMLGFLGTVVGITQTLGGLDFTDGQAAVDRLKSGLYVAFDTTAIGLVLSVVAIFLQFPVERAEQQLLALVDRRTGELLAAHLPDPAAGGSAGQLAALCDGVLSAVRQSVAAQADVWRQTIDGAHRHWQQVTATTANELSQAIGNALTPALEGHAREMRQVQRDGADQIDHRWQQWQLALSDNARILLAHQQTLVRQAELLADSHARAAELAALQQSLDRNLQSLVATNDAVQRGLQTAVGAEGMSDAVRTLARAVDILADHLPRRQGDEASEPADRASRIEGAKKPVRAARRAA